MPAVRCPRERTEEVRRALMERGLVDTSRSFASDGKDRLIPVSRAPAIDLPRYGAEYEDDFTAPRRSKQATPFADVEGLLGLPSRLASHLPRKWELLGDVLVVRLPEALRDIEEEVGAAYAEVLGAKTVAADEGGSRGRFREPSLRVIWGDGTETVHTENGVRYRLDAAKVMFSSGNIHERIRMASVCRDGEVVVDMFAGAGHLSLPMAVHSRPAKVHACEVNPTAHHYLVENIFLNRVEDVVDASLGDCLETAPSGVADRVVMGYLSSTGDHVMKAIEAIRDRGTVHYHEACPAELRDTRPRDRVRRAAEAIGAEVLSIREAVVKSYAPGVSHMVLDVDVRR